MRNLTRILSIFVFLAQADAYTVVLKNGRHVQGSVIAEDARTLQIHDASTGARLSIKKDQVDSDATTAANRAAESESPAATRPAAGTPKQEPMPLAQLARTLRSTRTGNVRTYTMADLERAPELSLLSTAPADAGSSGSADGANAPGSEDAWRREARSFRREVEAAEDRVAAAEKACVREQSRRQQELLTPHKQAQNMSDLMDTPAECQRLASLQERLTGARDRLADFLERARKSGVPWRWVE